MIRYLSVVPLLISASAGAAPVIGTARAIDGDSLMVSDQEVRLFGIDAPELMQTCTRNGEPWNCGQVAKDQLAKLIAGKQVVCVPVTVDRYRRTVARCTAGAVELNRVMVAVGYAVAFRRYSLDYGSAEDSARASKRGLWSGTFELPAEVRQAEAGHRPESGAERTRARHERPVARGRRLEPQPTGGCRIKGNHSRRGELIYHLPGRPYYDQTVAEAIFCSEDQARAAGYRRSRADRQR